MEWWIWKRNALCNWLEQSDEASRELDVPWEDTPITVSEPIYSIIKEEVIYEEYEALESVYKLLAEINNIPVFKNAINLVQETTFTYSIDELETVAITPKPSKGVILIYDSLLEEITSIPTFKEEKHDILTTYLLQRPTYSHHGKL